MESQQWVMIATMITCTILGVALNFVIMVVRAVKLFQRRKISAYHFVIMQVAFADFIFALFIIMDIKTIMNHNHWTYPSSACKIMKPMQSVAGSVPALFMLLLAYERYQGIKNTLTHKFNIIKVTMVVIFIWLFTAMSFIPYIMALNVDNTFCKEFDYPSQNFSKGYQLYLLLIYYLTPGCATAYLHARIYTYLKKQSREMTVHVRYSGVSSDVNENGSLSSEKTNLSADALHIIAEEDEVFQQNDNRDNTFKNILNKSIRKCLKKVTNRKKKNRGRKLKIHILLAITISFFVFMFPTQLWFLLEVFQLWPRETTYQRLTQFFISLVYMHCCANGILYSIMDRKFRKDIVLTVKSMYTCTPYHRRDLPPSPSTRKRKTGLISPSSPADNE